MLRIAVINQSRKVKPEKARAAVAAINIQLKEHFSPVWHIQARCRIFRDLSAVPDDFARVIISDQVWDDAEGYHDRDPLGRPIGFVSTGISKELDESWTVTLSHEILELCANPLATLYVVAKHPEKSHDVSFWYEACDPVQDLTYRINRIEVSDFVYPLYFTPERERGAKNHHLNTRLNSLGLAPGGYVGFYDPQTGQDENIFADRRAMERNEIKGQLGRWRRSSKGRGLFRGRVA